jgi:hypothetical protein
VHKITIHAENAEMYQLGAPCGGDMTAHILADAQPMHRKVRLIRRVCGRDERVYRQPKATPW